MGSLADSASGGMQMARDRNQGTDKYTYIGEDNQTQPLLDMGFSVNDWLNQLRAQNNALFGGVGYGGSYGKAGKNKPSTAGAGTKLPSAGGIYGSNTGFAGPKAAQGGGGMNNARMANPGGGPNPYNPQIAANPALGVDHGGDYAGDAPGAGDQPVDWYNEGGDMGGQNGGPNGINLGQHFNYLPENDPNDGYFQRYPEILNDADNARPSSVKPQGSSTDPWSSPLGDSQDAPTGGLFGGYSEFGDPTDYEERIGAGWLDEYGNPTNEYDAGAADTFGTMRLGGLTGNESETRGLLGGLASNTEQGPLNDLANGIRNENEIETRGGFRKQALGAEDATDFELADRGLYGDFLSGLGGADGSGFSGFGGLGGGSGSATSGPAGGIGAGSAFGGAKAAFEAALAGKGFDDATKNAIQQEGMRTARGIFDNNASEMMRQRAMGGGQAGLYGALARQTADRASALGGQARQNTIDFAKEAQRQKEFGASGLANIAGIESSSAQADASRALQAQSLASQNARDAAQLRLAGISGLNAWDQQARDRQKFGLSGMNSQDEAARQQQLSALGQQGTQRMGALGLMNQQDDRASGRMGTGAAGLAGMGQQLYGRKNAALEGATGYADAQRKNRQYRLAGQQQLYGQGQQNFLSGLGTLLDIFKNPREKYHMGADTSGSGGFNI